MKKNFQSEYLTNFLNILLRQKRFVYFLFILQFIFISAFSQVTIEGTVKNSEGEPLMGVSVKTKGTGQGTMSDSKGDFHLIAAENSLLVFTSVRYLSQEIPATSKKHIIVILTDSASTLNEVVVVGYGSQKKINLTGAVDQIDNKYLQNKPVPNVSRALEGVVPNLNIKYSDGSPNSNPTYNIRGLTSIGAGGSALILIDGVVGDPSTLNPNDIETITVLKDAASSAIYGSRGVFGVVLITTKTPNKLKTNITYSSNYSANKRTVIPHVVTDGYQYANLFNQSYSAWYNYTTEPSTVGASGISFSSNYLDSLKYRSEHPGTLPEVTINPSTGEYTYYGNTDWNKLLYADNIPGMQQSLSVSGGNTKADYLISGLYYKQAGIYKIRSDKYNKYNLRAKGDIHVTDWLTFSGNTVFSSIDYTNPFNSNIWSSLFVSGNGSPMAVMYNPDGTLTKAAANSIGALLGGGQTETQQNYNENNVSFFASIIKNTLTLRGDFSYQNTITQTQVKNVAIPYSIKPGLISQLGSSSLSQTNQKQNYYAYNLYSNYKHNFGNHNLEVLLGGNIEISKFQNLTVSRDNLLIPELSDFNIAVGQNSNIVGGGNEWATTGVFSRINYSFKDKYLLEVNGRYDGASKFPVNKQFGVFPSVSAGWRISEEKFMNGTKSWLNNLKIRASYGSLGNSQIAPYLYLEQLRAVLSPIIINGQLPAYIRNPDVIPDNFTWETATTSDVGIDMDLLDNRLSASFDWYIRKTTNMITAGPTLPLVFGANVPKGNNADLKTRGFELSLLWKDQINTRKNLSYSVRFTLADNVSYITKFNNPLGLLTRNDYTFQPLNYYVGQRVGDIWGYETAGLFTSEEDIQKHADQSFVQVGAANIALPGDIKFKDLNNDGKIDKGKNTLQDHGDQKIIGNSTPRYSFGVTTNLNWNNFSLSAFFQGVAKRDWYPSYGSTSFWGQYTVWYGAIPESTLKNNWTFNGNDPNSYWPRYRGPMPYGERELQPQTRYLQNAAYIRLKSLTISYSLPKPIVEKLKGVNVQFYLSGQNIWTYSPLFKITKDIDPEVIENASSSGYDGITYPMLKTYTIGANISL